MRPFCAPSCPGGEIVFAGTPREMVERGRTITAEYLRKSL